MTENENTSALTTGSSSELRPTDASSTGRIQLFQEYDNSTEDFESYLDRFECYCELNGVSTGNQVLLFISSVGQEIYKRLKSISFPKAPKELSYDEIKNSLCSHFSPKPLPSVEKQKFRARKQGEQESFNEFLGSLKKLSVHCGFDSEGRLEEEILDQIITGIHNKQTQNYFLRTPNLTLGDAVKEALADELAVKGVENLHSRNPKISSILGNGNLSGIIFLFSAL